MCCRTTSRQIRGFTGFTLVFSRDSCHALEPPHTVELFSTFLSALLVLKFNCVDSPCLHPGAAASVSALFFKLRLMLNNVCGWTSVRLLHSPYFVIPLYALVFNKESLHYAFYIFFSIGAIHQAKIFKHTGDSKHRRAHFILWMGVAEWPWWVWEKRRCWIHLANILELDPYLLLHIPVHFNGSVLRASALLVLVECEMGKWRERLLLQNVKVLPI